MKNFANNTKMKGLCDIIQGIEFSNPACIFVIYNIIKFDMQWLRLICRDYFISYYVVKIHKLSQ